MCLPKSSIGKKALMSITGLVLFGFVVMHMLGNLQIFLGPEALNSYAAKLQGLPELLWPARLILLTALIFHVWTAAVLTIENRRARPIAYVKKERVYASFASKTMWISGLTIFFFIVYHLLHYTFGQIQPQFYELHDAYGRHDVYSMVVASFGYWPISLTYIVAIALLALHLDHGAAVWLQSLGLQNDRLRPLMDKFGRASAILIFVGNSSIPLAVLSGLIKLPVKV